MNQRERLVRTLTCNNPDRPSYGDYLVYPSTQQRWESEGLPKGLIQAKLYDYFGFDKIDFWIDGNLITRNGPLPPYEEKTLQDTDEYIIMQVENGDVIKFLKNNPPPAMPQFLAHPVTDRKSWENLKKRLDPDTYERLPRITGNYVKNKIDDIAANSAIREVPFGAWLGGTYGYIRNWMGVENASHCFYDDPGMIEDMVQHLTHFYAGMFTNIVATGAQLDWVMFWEDMAYNHGSLLSPELYVKYCMPFYHTMIDLVKQNGIKVIMLDCDGNIDQLIPIWLDAGINVMHPMEVAAGMDVRKVRKQYGTKVGFLGGIDKRELAKDRAAIDAEVIPKVRAMLDTGGGLITECDHAVPPDISFDNYRYYRDLVRELMHER